MLSSVRVNTPGETHLLPGRIVEIGEFNAANRDAKEAGKEEAQGERLLLGITKVSLTTKSFLAAASFMETARVLIDASVTGKADDLSGLKENVIIGRLIPAGTGYRKPGVDYKTAMAAGLDTSLLEEDTSEIAPVEEVEVSAEMPEEEVAE